MRRRGGSRAAQPSSAASRCAHEAGDARRRFGYFFGIDAMIFLASSSHACMYLMESFPAMKLPSSAY
jgi:hypothetical protein